MGVYINMEMPEHCGECKLKATYDDETFCPFFADNVEYWIAVGRRHEDCPLGYIPPHGDLIDRDANLSVMRQVLDSPYTDHGKIDTAMLKACITMFEEAPTVIEAEEGE